LDTKLKTCEKVLNISFWDTHDASSCSVFSSTTDCWKIASGSIYFIGVVFCLLKLEQKVPRIVSFAYTAFKTETENNKHKWEATCIQCKTTITEKPGTTLVFVK